MILIKPKWYCKTYRRIGKVPELGQAGRRSGLYQVDKASELVLYTTLNDDGSMAIKRKRKMVLTHELGGIEQERDFHIPLRKVYLTRPVS